MFYHLLRIELQSTPDATMLKPAYPLVTLWEQITPSWEGFSQGWVWGATRVSPIASDTADIWYPLILRAIPENYHTLLVVPLDEMHLGYNPWPKSLLVQLYEHYPTAWILAQSRWPILSVQGGNRL